MADLDEQQLIKLARELVMNIRNYQLTFADFGIDENDYQQIEKNEFFRKVKEHFTLDWNAATSTEERLRIESLAYCERLTPIVTKRAMMPDANLGASTDVLKQLAKQAGIGELKGEKASAERFVISINLGGDVETYNKSIEVTPNDTPPEGTAGQPEEPVLQFIRATDKET